MGQIRRTLYIDGKMPARTLQERLRCIIGPDAPSPADADHLRFLAADLVDCGLPSLATEAGQRLASHAAADCDLVIVDNLSSLTPGVRENEADDWAPLQGRLLALRRAGKAVLVVHHAGKAGTQRGTSRREDVMDLVVALRRPEGYRRDDGARFTVHLEKARNLVGREAETFEAQLVAGVDGTLTWTERAAQERQADTIRMLRQGSSLRAIERVTGVSKSTVQRIAAREADTVPVSQPSRGATGTDAVHAAELSAGGDPRS